MQSSEYLRRRLQTMPKVIMSPKQVDSSTYIWGKTVQATKLKGCCSAPQTFPITFPCTTLPVDVGTASPADSYLGIKPAAYYSNTCPANSGAPPQLASKHCNCLSPLTLTNTVLVTIPNTVASYLPINGTVSTWTDTAGTLNATMTGSPTYSPTLGYTFNGTTQYGRIPSSTGINNFDNTNTYSVEIWFKPSSGQPSATLATVLEKWNSTNQQRYPYVFRYSETATSLTMAVFDGTRNPALNISGININTWVQVVGVFNFTTHIMTAYKNGSSDGTLTLANVGNVANTSLVAIGHRIKLTDGSPEFMFKGSIGMIRFYNTALSKDQVSQIFSNTRSTFGI